ncbi:uncharacterized protein LOC135496992 [Lineus longissimus]|uniref:uncharacterized protein LOC135496992 n=1 Tax=Lineus longissimus TaxID=88925 RepID=UPI00315C5061
MASFLSCPMGQGPGHSPPSEGFSPMPDFSLDITTESFLEADYGHKKLPESEDSPVSMIPQPSFPKVSPPLLTPDPDLCLTPDKPERQPIVRVEKNKHVRFDVPASESGMSVSSVATESSDNTDENKENSAEDLNPDEGSKVYRYVQSKTKEIPEFKQLVDNNENFVKTDKDSVHIFAKLKPKKIDSNNNAATVPKVLQSDFEEPPAPRQRLPPESAKVYFPRPLPKITQPGVVTAEEHIFQRPEFHSTLKVNQEMRQLKVASLDVVKAVEDKLDGSPNTRNQFKEKVTARVNPVKPQFQSLECTDVERVADIIKQAEIQRKNLIKGPNLESTRIQDSRFPEPNIMDLFTPDLQVETCSYNIDSLPKFTEPLQTAPDNTAFELYRHLRIWHDLP